MTEVRNDRIGDEVNNVDMRCVECCDGRGEVMLDLAPHLTKNSFVDENEIEVYYKVCPNCGNRIECERQVKSSIDFAPTYVANNKHKGVWKNSFNYEDYKYDPSNCEK